jgi:hypothetical protein
LATAALHVELVELHPLAEADSVIIRMDVSSFADVAR